MPIRLITPNRASCMLATATIICMVNVVWDASTRYENRNEFPINKLLSGPLQQNDPVLIEWVQMKMRPPSTHPYYMLSFEMNGLAEENDTRKIVSPSQEFILECFEEYIERLGIKRGTYLEAGAYDGEFLSNTLSLELDYEFNGVLIEANPHFFDKLILKNRKAWALNMCLNVHPWASKELFREAAALYNTNHLRHSTKPLPEIERHLNLGSSGLAMFPETNNHYSYYVEDITMKVKYATGFWCNYHKYRNRGFLTVYNDEFEVQCVPLYTVMKALGWKHIDILSLDVQRAELGILKTLPWDEVSFSVMAIEADDNQEIREFLRPKGYVLWHSRDQDHVFIRKNLLEFLTRDPAPSGSSIKVTKKAKRKPKIKPVHRKRI